MGEHAGDQGGAREVLSRECAPASATGSAERTRSVGLIRRAVSAHCRDLLALGHAAFAGLQKLQVSRRAHASSHPPHGNQDKQQQDCANRRKIAPIILITTPLPQTEPILYRCRRVFKCKACHRQFSATSGNLLACRKLPFRTLFRPPVGSVTLPNRARSNSAGTSGSCRSDGLRAMSALLRLGRLGAFSPM
jgi:hypothetical protein